MVNVQERKVELFMLFAQAAVRDQNIPLDTNMELFRYFHQFTHLLNTPAKYQDDFLNQAKLLLKDHVICVNT